MSDALVRLALTHSECRPTRHAVVARRLAAFAAGMAVAAAHAAPASYGVNLLKNPGAEKGAGSSTGYEIVPVPGWTSASGATVVTYGAPGGFPTAADPGPPTRGANFFAGGPTSTHSSLAQTVNVSNLAADIDAGWVQAALSGHFGGYLHQQDRARLLVRFLDAAGVQIGLGSTADVTPLDRLGQTGLFKRSQPGLAVPPGTRKLRVEIGFYIFEGNYNDGYADAVSLKLKKLP